MVLGFLLVVRDDGARAPVAEFSRSADPSHWGGRVLRGSGGFAVRRCEMADGRVFW